MKIKLHSTTADVTMTAREAKIVRSGAVPMIYSPGGMGLDGYPPAEGGTVRFGGACFVNIEANLRASLDAFRAALANAERVFQEVEDEQAGFNAFPSSSFRKGFPKWPSCPFRQPERIAAWQRGIDAAHEAILSAT
jgi:hypothetical protein